MKKMKKIIVTLFALPLVSVATPTMAASWHYDFNPGEDVSQLTFFNLTPQPPLPTSPTYTLNGNLEMHIPNNKAYDLASWVNLDAPRLYRNVMSEAFTLETKFDTTASTYTYLSGIFLYNTAGGIDANDLIFGANTDSLKIDQGIPTNHSGPFAWTGIGAYADLYLQVVHDGSNNYNFSYKLADADPWTLHASLSGYSFDSLGLITKTWYNPSAGYPEVFVNYDYLDYNSVVPIPGAVWLFGSGVISLLALKRKKKQVAQG